MLKGLTLLIAGFVGIDGFMDLATAQSNAKKMADKMSLEELLGQMNQIEVGSFTNDDWNKNGEKMLNVTRVEEYASQYVGAYLNLIPSLAEWGRPLWNASQYRDLVEKLQQIHLKTSQVPIIYGFDSIHGANYIGNATLFPQPINVGATFDIAHAATVGKYTGRDTKAAGMPWVFGPMLEVVRHKHWSRMYESFNEDTVAVATLGEAYIKAIQEQGVAACFKHFIGYSDPTDGNDRTDVSMASYELLNYFVPPFRAAIDNAKVMSGMGTYVGWNGVPMAANNVTSKLLLRHDLKFDGTMVTDWGEMYLLNEPRHLVKTYQDAVDLSLSQTTYDMVMAPYDTSFIQYAKNLIALKRLSRDRIQQSAERILTLKWQLELFTNPVPGKELVTLVEDAESQKFALQVAQDSIVLLKNNKNVLPLPRNVTSIFLTGSSIDNIGLQCGGWSLAWQGISGNDAFPHGKSIRQAIETHVNSTSINQTNITTLEAVNIQGNITYATLAIAMKLAANSTYTIIAIGERTYAENFGNSDPQALPEGFVDYMKALATTNTTIVLVLLEGRPRTLNGIAELADAVIWGGLPCEFGGQAISDVLFGKVNPNGKLPYTYPKTDSFVNLATPYYFRRADKCVKGWRNESDCPIEWPFGAGISYTTFSYTEFTLSSTFVASSSPQLTISVKVTNTGAVAGREVVFMTPPITHNLSETKLLKKFTKIQLNASQSQTVQFVLTPDDWGYYSNTIGNGLSKVAPTGSYSLFVKADTDCFKSGTAALCGVFKWDNGTKYRSTACELINPFSTFCGIFSTLLLFLI